MAGLVCAVAAHNGGLPAVVDHVGGGLRGDVSLVFGQNGFHDDGVRCSVKILLSEVRPLDDYME
jgi:hypothetical protein